MKRRSFIKSALATTSMAAAAPHILSGMAVRANSPVIALSPTTLEGDSILIIIQLFGGNDGLNTIVPVDSDDYYKIRPTIAVQKKDAWQWLNTDLYFHPALVKSAYRNGLGGLMDEGRLAVVQDVGYENPNLSHFRSTDIWLSGINSSDPFVRLSEGWIGKFMSRALPDFPQVLPEHPLCVQIGGTLSMLLQSQKGDMGIALTDPQKFFELGKGLSPDLDELTEDSSYAKEFNYIRGIAEQSDKYSQIVIDAFNKGKNRVTYSTSGLPAQLGLIARLISGGLKSRVYMCSMGGFDTHVAQQQFDDPTKGLHPSLMSQIANGIAMFMHDALQQGFVDRVVGLTVSEFGRRPFENGSRGTDHGAASVQFVFGSGNSIRSSRYGNAPNLKDFDSNGDIAYQNDYRRVYADVMQNWFGASPEDTEAVLGERIAPLGVIKKRVSSVRETITNSDSNNAVVIAPNPTIDGNTYILFELNRAVEVSISLYSTRGQFVKDIHKGFLSAGRQSILASNLQTGNYVVIITAGQHTIHSSISVVR
jgi:uncharacterized protein (DUF1501 family)